MAAMRVVVFGLALGLCACGTRTEAPSSAGCLGFGAGVPIVAPTMLPAMSWDAVEPGFIAGARYDHAAIARLRPLSTSASEAIRILDGAPVRRIEFDGGMFSLLWSYERRLPTISGDPSSGEAILAEPSSGTWNSGADLETRFAKSGVELLFDPSGRMTQILSSASEEEDEEISPFAEELRPTSLGPLEPVGALHAVRVVWLARHGGERLAGDAYDHARIPDLVCGVTSAAEASVVLGGEPVQRDEFDDKTFDLVWSYRSQRLATSVRLRFDPDALLRTITDCKPEYIGMCGAGQKSPREPNLVRQRVRTIDLLNAR
jgi:hypothetical protein